MVFFLGNFFFSSQYNLIAMQVSISGMIKRNHSPAKCLAESSTLEMYIRAPTVCSRGLRNRRMNETPFLSPVGLKVAKGGIKPLCTNGARRWENQEGAFALRMDRTCSHRKKLYPWKAQAGRL